MDRMLYVAMNGAKETLIAQGVNSNNLANANTLGFLSDLHQFRSMPVFGDGHPSRVYGMGEKPATDFTPGTIIHTGKSLDVALNSRGWIAVQAPDSTEAYTRRGDLVMDVNGLLTTGNGLPVLGNGGPIAIPPAEQLFIASDGTISIRPLGENPDTLAEIDRIRLVNPDKSRLIKGEDGLMRIKDGGVAEADLEVKLFNGSLESSNVNMVGALVNMIELARRFEFQIKMMKTAEEIENATAGIMKMTG